MTDIVRQYSTGTIRRLTTGDGVLLASSLREIDIIELKKFDGSAPEAAIRQSVENSKIAFSLHDNQERLLAVTGVGWTFNPRVGRVWLLATPHFDGASFTIARGTRDLIRYFMQGHDVLSNFVYSKNRKTVRWLKWSGFETVSEQTTKHSGGETFYEMACFKDAVVRDLYMNKDWQTFSDTCGFAPIEAGRLE